MRGRAFRRAVTRDERRETSLRCGHSAASFPIPARQDAAPPEVARDLLNKHRGTSGGVVSGRDAWREITENIGVFVCLPLSRHLAGGPPALPVAARSGRSTLKGRAKLSKLSLFPSALQAPPFADGPSDCAKSGGRGGVEGMGRQGASSMRRMRSWSQRAASSKEERTGRSAFWAS